MATIKTKFDSTCNRCDEPIKVGDTVEWEPGAGAWHPKCRSKPKLQKKAPVQEPPAVADGTYTVVLNPTPPEERITIKVETKTGGKLQGKTVLSFMHGSDNLRSFTGFGFLFGSRVLVWKRMLGAIKTPQAQKAMEVLINSDDQEEFGNSYALLSSRCYSCGRVLTVPVSINKGLGPECARRRTR